MTVTSFFSDRSLILLNHDLHIEWSEKPVALDGSIHVIPCEVMSTMVPSEVVSCKPYCKSTATPWRIHTTSKAFCGIMPSYARCFAQ